MTVGAIVWAVIGGAWVLWLGITAVVRPWPGIFRLTQRVVGSWAGRAIALAAWGGVGWHLFCQRP